MRACASSGGDHSGPFAIPLIKGEIKGDYLHSVINQFRAMDVLFAGAPSFFKPRVLPPFLHTPGTTEALSYYDTSPLRETLERLVDFRPHQRGKMRLSVGATNVRTGNFAYFDTTTHQIRPEHVMASGALPPGFPPVEIEGELYWDGGIVSNTPLQWVLDSHPREDTLAFQVDLWNARGEIPATSPKSICAPRRSAIRAAPGWAPTSSKNRSGCAARSITC